MIKILFLAANPPDTEPLEIDEEIRAIDDELQSSSSRNSFSLHSHWAVHADDLQKLIRRYRPQIVHFSGHGSKDEKLVLQDNTEKGEQISPESLSELFRLFRDDVHCVVLNACYSEAHARAIAEYIDAVIGIVEEVEDKNATKFSAAFYGALADNKDVQTAFEFGRNAVQLHDQAGRNDRTAWLLLTRDNDKVRPDQIYIGTGVLHSTDHYVWALLTVVALAVGLYYATQIMLRWLHVDQGFITLFTQMLTAAFVIVSLLGGLGNEWGRTAIRSSWETITDRYPQLQKTRQLFVATALLALVLAGVFRWGTPYVAGKYTESGLAALGTGKWNDVFAGFLNAAKAAPDSVCHFYNLGLGYELGAGPDDERRAIEAYGRALSIDDQFLPTYNNLGRLYLKNPETQNKALELLLTGEKMLDRMQGKPDACGLNRDQQMLLKGVLLKNLGNAYLLKKVPTTAENYLNQAAQVFKDYDQKTPGSTVIYWAELHLLRAKALEVEGKCESSKSAWLDSEGYARAFSASKLCRDHAGLSNPQCTEVDVWVAEAEEALAKQCSPP